MGLSSFLLVDMCYDADTSSVITVYRYPGFWGPNGWIPGTPVEIQISGTITIADDTALEQVPEGDRVKGALQLVSPVQIYTTLTEQNSTPGSPVPALSDEIKSDYGGSWSMYRVAHCAWWARYGVWIAVLIRTRGC